MEWKRHRKRPAERVLIRKDRPPKTGNPEADADAHAVTVRFTSEEWAVIEQHVLASRGLASIGEVIK